MSGDGEKLIGNGSGTRIGSPRPADPALEGVCQAVGSAQIQEADTLGVAPPLVPSMDSPPLSATLISARWREQSADSDLSLAATPASDPAFQAGRQQVVKRAVRVEGGVTCWAVSFTSSRPHAQCALPSVDEEKIYSTREFAEHVRRGGEEGGASAAGSARRFRPPASSATPLHDAGR